jgi:hypothetical protein
MNRFLLAEYETAHALRRAAERAFDLGRPALDALTPNPIEGVADLLAPPKARAPIGWVMFIAGATGASAGYLMQWFSAVIDYPIISGGRPLNSWPAFMLVPYELAILSAGIAGLLGWMWMCGLPKLFHPLFEAKVTQRASQDRYLLVFRRERGLMGWIEQHLKPTAVHEADA